MVRPVRLALCQFSSSASFASNLSRLESTVSHCALNQKAQIVCFPEFFLQGIVQDSPERVRQAGDSHEELCAIARRYEVDLVVGTLTERHRRGESESQVESDGEEKVYNTAYYISKKGEILGRYRKRNLWHPEKDYLHPGDEDHSVFQTDYAKTGMLICWDLAWPEAFRALMKQDVELVICPTYWSMDDIEQGREHDADGAGEASWLDSMVISRAYENECIVAFVNCGGPKEKGFLGRSAVAAPFKGVLGRADGCEEQVTVVDIDLDILKESKKVYKIREDYRKNFDSTA